MRSSTLPTFAILATSFLAQDALAIPYDRRAADAVMTEVATVTQQAGGPIPTGAPLGIPNAGPNAEPQGTDKDVEADPPVSGPGNPAPAAPSSAPSSEGQTSASSGNTKKRGLAYNDASLLKGFTGPGSKAGWCYNWDSSAGSIPSGLEYVPMLHDFRSDKLSAWQSNANSALSSGATHLQFINEPDMSADPSVGGCDTSPSDAADGFVKHMMPFKGKAKIGSPAVSNGITQPGTSKPAGIPYLKQFFSLCTTCHFDFVPLHWYGTDPEDLKKHVQDVRDAVKGVEAVAKDGNGNPKLWITEFGLNGGNPDTISDFLNKVMPWLDGQDYVERYAYQFVADNFLVTGTSPNKAGKTFAGVS